MEVVSFAPAVHLNIKTKHQRRNDIDTFTTNTRTRIQINKYTHIYAHMFFMQTFKKIYNFIAKRTQLILHSVRVYLSVCKIVCRCRSLYENYSKIPYINNNKKKKFYLQ